MEKELLIVQSHPRIFVDDALLASIRRHIKRLIASIIEAIFNVLGPPDPTVRRTHLSMDKWTEAIISYKNILLGLSWNTRKLTVGIPREYLSNPRSNQEKPLSLQENHGLRAQQDHRENGAHRSSCQLGLPSNVPPLCICLFFSDTK